MDCSGLKINPFHCSILYYFWRQTFFDCCSVFQLSWTHFPRKLHKIGEKLCVKLIFRGWKILQKAWLSEDTQQSSCFNPLHARWKEGRKVSLLTSRQELNSDLCVVRVWLRPAVHLHHRNLTVRAFPVWCICVSYYSVMSMTAGRDNTCQICKSARW